MRLEDRMRLESIQLGNVRSFLGRDVLRIDDFNRDEIAYVLEAARVLGESHRRNMRDLRGFEYKDLLEGLVISTDFFEPSSRTHDSHWFAAENLGAKVMPARRGAEATSNVKGEPIPHDLVTLNCYGSHAIVIRTKLEGVPQLASDYLSKMVEAHPDHLLFKPCIINGGDGAHEHPTQAFLDLLTLYMTYDIDFRGEPRIDSDGAGLRRQDVLSGLTMIAFGDSLKGRTFKSLAKALSRFDDNEVVVVSPAQVRAPPDELRELERRGLNVKVFDSLEESMIHANTRKRPFFYGLRVQEERLDPKDYEAVRGKVCMTPEILDMYQGSDVLPIMHPLPVNKKNPEIAPSVDFRKEAYIFHQMAMGQYARMALLGLVLGRIETSADDNRYVDVRVKKDEKMFRRISMKEHDDDNEAVLRTLDDIIRKEPGQDALRRFVAGCAGAKDYQKVADQFMELLSEITDNGRLIELVRHLTFRFKPGEDGFVIDHLDDGKTGLVKYHLGLSQLKERMDAGGNRILVSAVDGLVGRTGPKGVIKVRGYIPELSRQLQYTWLLSRKVPRITIIRDGLPAEKFEPAQPYELVDFNYCPNIMCASGPEHREARGIPPVFYRTGSSEYQCRYCDAKVEVAKMRLIKTDRQNAG
jgi:aspartate carbamoyltransferase catalytic subunit